MMRKKRTERVVEKPKPKEADMNKVVQAVECLLDYEKTIDVKVIAPEGRKAIADIIQRNKEPSIQIIEECVALRLKPIWDKVDGMEKQLDKMEDLMEEILDSIEGNNEGNNTISNETVS